MKFERWKFVIATDAGLEDYYYRYLHPGVHRIQYRLCCDDFKTCSHAGKSVCVSDRYYKVANIHDGAAFDTYDTAKMVATLLGIVR